MRKRDELINLQDEKEKLEERLEEVVRDCGERVRKEKERSTDYVNAADEALRRIGSQHAKHTRNLIQDIEGGCDKKLAEELAQIKRDKEVLDARFAHEQATLKQTEEEAEKAETMTELYRSEFELESGTRC